MTHRRSPRRTWAWRSAPGPTWAIEASDLTLVSGDLRAAADAIRLSRATLRTIKQNLAWAFGYNVAALPLAAAGLLNPLIAAAAMAVSSVSVVGNALRLRRFRSAHDGTGAGTSPFYSGSRGSRSRESPLLRPWPRSARRSSSPTSPGSPP